MSYSCLENPMKPRQFPGLCIIPRCIRFLQFLLCQHLHPCLHRLFKFSHWLLTFSSWMIMGDCVKRVGMFFTQYYSRRESCVCVFHVVIMALSTPHPAPFYAETRQPWAGTCGSRFGGWAPGWAPLFAPTRLTSAGPAARGRFRTHAPLLHPCFVYNEHVFFIPPAGAVMYGRHSLN